MPRMRAASSSVGVRASTRRMCSRSIVLEREVAAERAARGRVRRRCARGAPSGSMTRPGHRIDARSMALRSSRTLPGQRVARASAASAAGDELGARRAGAAREEGEEARAPAAGCPRGRSRSGGTTHLDDVEPVEQVLAEAARAHVGLEVAVGGGDDAHVGACGCASRRRARTARPAGSAAAWPAARAAARRSRRGRACRPRPPRRGPAGRARRR